MDNVSSLSLGVLAACFLNLALGDKAKALNLVLCVLAAGVVLTEGDVDIFQDSKFALLLSGGSLFLILMMAFVYFGSKYIPMASELSSLTNRQRLQRFIISTTIILLSATCLWLGFSYILPETSSASLASAELGDLRILFGGLFLGACLQIALIPLAGVFQIALTDKH